MRGTAGERSGQRLLQALCILLLLALLIGILVAEAHRSATAVGRERATLAAFTHVDALAGYVFREETTVPSRNHGEVEYQVPHGSAVAAGDDLAAVYEDDPARRAEAAELYEEIARLERSLKPDIVAWQATYADSYEALMSSLGAGDWRSGLSDAELLAATLERRSAFANNGEAVKARIAELREQADEMVRYLDDPETVSAKVNGYFSYETDGYEALFGTAAIDHLTPEGLQRLLDACETSADTVGKVVSAEAFYLAVPILPTEAEKYTVGDAYHVRLKKGGETDMQLVRIAYSADASQALLLFRAEKMPAGMDLSRRQPIEVERETIAGIRVPIVALCTEGGENFVYVIKDGVAERRRVEILCREAGTCIVSERADEDYLDIGENILITARSVYEGKVLNE